MLRLTIAFIVVTLTGLPVLPTMCHTWYGAKATSESCHDEAVGNGSAAERAECRALVTDYPFIREDARPVLHAVPYLPVASTAPTPVSAMHMMIALRRPAVSGVPATTLVLRL